MGKWDRKEARRQQVERLLASGMGVEEWSSLNHVRKSTVYGWLNEFRRTEPELFGGYEVAHAGDGTRCWFHVVRKEIAQRSALALPSDATRGSPAESPAFAVVDATSLAGCQHARTPGPAITVRIAGVEVDVPAGADAGDVERVLRAVSSL